MDISRSDLGLLISLNALLQTQSVSRAAEDLGLSQPALSTQLARLRDIFSDPLLVQSGRKMLLSSRAKEIQAPLRRHLEDLDRLVKETAAFDPQTNEDTFRIGLPDFLAASLMPKIIQGVSDKAPFMKFASLTAGEKNWAALEQDKYDFLITSIRLTPDNAVSKKLYEESFAMVQRKGHPRGQNALSLDEYCSLDHALISTSGGSFSGPVDKTLKAMGKKRRVSISVSSFLVAPQLIAETNKVITLPASIARLYSQQVDTFKLPFEQANFPIYLSWHPKRRGDASHGWVKDQIILELKDLS